MGNYRHCTIRFCNLICIYAELRGCYCILIHWFMDFQNKALKFISAYLTFISRLTVLSNVTVYPDNFWISFFGEVFYTFLALGAQTNSIFKNIQIFRTKTFFFQTINFRENNERTPRKLQTNCGSKNYTTITKQTTRQVS